MSRCQDRWASASLSRHGVKITNYLMKRTVCSTELKTLVINHSLRFSVSTWYHCIYEMKKLRKGEIALIGNNQLFLSSPPIRS